MRPRIRTLKPELWQDERVGELSHGARLLFIGLITMADDEGRLRELPAAILGHIFPYDGISPARCSRWIAEVAATGMIVRYVVDGKRYIAFPKWDRHQKIDRPSLSELPEFSSNGSTTNRRGLDEGSIPPRRRASLPVPSDPDPIPEQQQTTTEQLPGDFPDEIKPHLDAAFAVLSEIAERHKAKAVSRYQVAMTMTTRARKPLVQAAHDCGAYWDSKGKPLRDVNAAYRNWLDRCPDLASVEHLGPAPLRVVGGKRDYSEYDRAAGL